MEKKEISMHKKVFKGTLAKTEKQKQEERKK